MEPCPVSYGRTRYLFDSRFDKAKHPRDKDGKFARTGTNTVRTEVQETPEVPGELRRRHSVSGPKVHHMARAVLSPDQGEAVRAYAEAGSAFMNIQRTLWSGKEPEGPVGQQISCIRKAISGVTLTEQVKVYRGVTRKDFVATLKEGAVFREDGFCSTSTAAEIAGQYAGPEGAVLEIHMPRGSHALSVERSWDIRSRGVETFREKEILLPDHSCFVVRKVRHQGHGRPIHAVIELIPSRYPAGRKGR